MAAYSTKSYYMNSSNDTSKGYAIAGSDASYQYYNNMTWSMWVAIGPGNAKHIWSLWEQISGNNRSWLFSTQTDGTFRCLFSWNGTNFSNHKTTSVVCDYSWKHVVFTFASGTIGCYVNGQSMSLTTTTAWTGGAVALHNPAIQHIIGSHSPSAPVNDANPGGCVQNFSLWNKVLSAAEILELYNGGAPYAITGHSATANLTNWLRLDQTDTSSTITDQIDSGANATITETGTSGVFNQGDSYPNPNAIEIPTVDEIADAVWDEVLTGATHNISTSAGRRLRNISAIDSVDSSVNDASATTTSFVTALTNATNDFYADQLIVFTSGTLDGQSRPVLSYNGTTKAITVSEALTSAPANGVTFTLHATHIHPNDQIATAVWDDQTSGHTTAGSFGAYIKKLLTVAKFLGLK